jgi:hypothetical protein
MIRLLHWCEMAIGYPTLEKLTQKCTESTQFCRQSVSWKLVRCVQPAALRDSSCLTRLDQIKIAPLDQRRNSKALWLQKSDVLHPRAIQVVGPGFESIFVTISLEEISLLSSSIKKL